MESSPLLEARGLKKTYRGNESVTESVPVLQGIDFKVEAGETIALLGASGSGKSTLLHCLGLLDHPDEGALYFEGRSTRELSESERARVRLTRIGFVFQFHHLVPELTALENVLLPLSLAGRTDRPWAEHLLARVGLTDKTKRFPWQLSGGEQQRVAVARALVNRPKILMTDEATGNLDRQRAQEILALMFETTRDVGATLLSVTHDEQLASQFQKQYRLKDGQVWDLTRS